MFCYCFTRLHKVYKTGSLTCLLLGNVYSAFTWGWCNLNVFRGYVYCIMLSLCLSYSSSPSIDLSVGGKIYSVSHGVG